MSEITRDDFVAAIRNNSKNGQWVKGKMLSEMLGISSNTVSKYAHRWNKMHPEDPIVIVRGSGYRMNCAPILEPEEKENRYDHSKTEEGYSDPTACGAIKSVDGCLNEGPFKPGDVWKVDFGNGSEDYRFLILKGFATTVSCLKIHKLESTETYNPVIHTPVSMQRKEIVDCRRVVAKPVRYFLEKDESYCVTNFDAIKRKIALLLDISIEVPVEKPVEVIKEVEKRVEVPVEVVKEVEKVVEKPVAMPLPSDEMELALAKQKADIYERITWAMLVNMGQNMEENT